MCEATLLYRVANKEHIELTSDINEVSDSVSEKLHISPVLTLV